MDSSIWAWVLLPVLVPLLVAVFTVPATAALVAAPVARAGPFSRATLAAALAAAAAFLGVALYGGLCRSWFDQNPTPAMFAVIALLFVMNGAHRLRTRPPEWLPTEMGSLVGDVAGIAAAAIFIL